MQSDTRIESFNRLGDASELTCWTDEIARMMSFSNVMASRTLRAVLHALHSHLPRNEADRLGLHLPAFARNVYDEGSQVDAQEEKSSESFLDSVAIACPELTDEQLQRAIWSVFTTLSHHVSPEVIRDVLGVLPVSIRGLWNTAA